MSWLFVELLKSFHELSYVQLSVHWSQRSPGAALTGEFGKMSASSFLYRLPGTLDFDRSPGQHGNTVPQLFMHAFTAFPIAILLLCKDFFN